ncbi:hypothetical protein HNQ91_001928 [Filimonas zeae]|uniref:Uncharacterized protein n=1 Tax=Filimonas zeae TaxID=1737353 RepID=A0A917MX65_9BACT|nr:hypothetical protein [Filimonas zeae]MDR6338877.1 hypothetical protein [Filimonas zeae]GGH66163.1 hypothetical protein GCM10011379_20060 [Filimonas zeae]
MKRKKRSVSYPHLSIATSLVARKKSLKELYRFCVISLFFSALAFAFDETIAKLITRIVHGNITNIDDLKWYRHAYAGAIKILAGTAGIVSATWVIYLRWMLPEKLRVKHFMYLPKHY